MMRNKIILIYLEMENDELDSTYRVDNYKVHCRPLLGFQYLSAVAKQSNFDTEIWDARLIKFNESEVADYAKKNNVRVFGFYSSFKLINPVKKFIINLKQISDLPVLVGGPGYRDYDLFLNNGADIICQGEGEETFAEILNYINYKKNDYQNIKGIIWRNSNGEIIINKPRELIKNLDDLPFPDRDSTPLKQYRDFYLLGMRLPYATMMTSRGCPFKCSYCDTSNIWNFKVRQRSPENVIAEIDILVKKYNVRFIDMLDDIFGLSFGWIEKFCALLIERKYDLHYKILINPTSFGKNQKKAFELLKKSGCNIIGIGMQTADETILQKVNRKTETGQALIDCVKNANNFGILTFVSFISGFPFEADDTPKKAIQLIKRAKPMMIDCYPLVYLKGSELERQLSACVINDSYSYNEKFARALIVKKYFYSNPFNILRLFVWILKNNPSWFAAMIKQYKFVMEVAGLI